MEKIRSKVYFADEKIKKSFHDLIKGKFEDKQLHEWLTRAFKDIEENAFCGIQIPKRLIPKEYISKYEITNLLKYDLPKGWRLLYSVGKEGIIVISIVKAINNLPRDYVFSLIPKA